MKKLFLALVAVIAMAGAVNAQNALGVRGAFGSSNGAELSFQMGMGSNRLELDFGWNTWENHGYYNLSGIYQWTGSIAGNFGWYAGLGANLGYWDGVNEGNLGLGFLVQAGVEYDFQALPLQVSLDVRPQWDVLGAHSGFGYGLALGLRYMF